MAEELRAALGVTRYERSNYRRGYRNGCKARTLTAPTGPVVLTLPHEEFRRRVKTQGSLPNEDAARILLFSLVASGQIKLRPIDGWRKIAAVLSRYTAVAA